MRSSDWVSQILRLAHSITVGSTLIVTQGSDYLTPSVPSHRNSGRVKGEVTILTYECGGQHTIHLRGQDDRGKMTEASYWSNILHSTPSLAGINILSLTLNSLLIS